ncbi:hypothetical protein BX661DRAFT_19352 [Kickxella alabastrina]|uniref:uncharacterized protein n=1 Tax=Kickxella alabastrina TaxID=61397 RepID=UPI002220A295|nr:uncharacterized protein BX661DRAFT_19352 [Kickxella alabastrina]KAI7818619.1 hypothetical protein BX661DRAFT_19352 [Kickxella alabastrina]
MVPLPLCLFSYAPVSAEATSLPAAAHSWLVLSLCPSSRFGFSLILFLLSANITGTSGSRSTSALSSCSLASRPISFAQCSHCTYLSHICSASLLRADPDCSLPLFASPACFAPRPCEWQTMRRTLAVVVSCLLFAPACPFRTLWPVRLVFVTLSSFGLVAHC